MPTISAHVDEDFADAVETAAKASAEKRVAPYIAEAVRQRMAREGMMPGSAMAELISMADEVGIENAVTAMRQTRRPLATQLKALAGMVGIEASSAVLAELRREQRRKARAA